MVTRRLTAAPLVAPRTFRPSACQTGAPTRFVARQTSYTRWVEVGMGESICITPEVAAAVSIRRERLEAALVGTVRATNSWKLLSQSASAFALATALVKLLK